MIEPNTQNKILAALLSDDHIFNERIDYIDQFIWASPEHQIVSRQNLSEFLSKILRDTFVKYKHYLRIPCLDFDDVSYSLFFV